MSKDKTKINRDEMRPEYDLWNLKGKTRGKYVKRYWEELVIQEEDTMFKKGFCGEIDKSQKQS